jgi:hypothetical protein
MDRIMPAELSRVRTIAAGLVVASCLAPVLMRARPLAARSREQTASLSGRVAFEGSAPPRPEDVSRISVTARPLQAGATVPPAVTVKADGTFEFTSLPIGRYRLAAAFPEPAQVAAGVRIQRWSLKSAMLQGVDLADTPFDLGPGDRVTAVVVTMTDRVAELSGTLRDPADKPVAGYTVLVFASDKLDWIVGSRRMPLPVQSGPDGTFRFIGLPPGQYRVAALSTIDPALATSEAFLTQVGPRAVALALGPGEHKVLNLRVTPRQP